MPKGFRASLRVWLAVGSPADDDILFSNVVYVPGPGRWDFFRCKFIHAWKITMARTRWGT
jgi:hypothetical protein